MNLREFINKYFYGWSIGSLTNCGTRHGTMLLIKREACVKLYFNLNGDTHWSGNQVTLERIDVC